MEKVITHGNLLIEDQFLQLLDTSINLSNIDNMNIFQYEKHALFSNVKEWIYGWGILLIICFFVKWLETILVIYSFTIFLLLYYNYKEHQKNLYGLKIETSAQKNIILNSNDREFLEELRGIIKQATKKTNINYTINMDDHHIINNGVINKGNKNKIKVEKNDK